MFVHQARILTLELSHLSILECLMVILHSLSFRMRFVFDSLSSDDSVNRLVTYLVEPAQEGDNDLRTFK